MDKEMVLIGCMYTVLMLVMYMQLILLTKISKLQAGLGFVIEMIKMLIMAYVEGDDEK